VSERSPGTNLLPLAALAVRLFFPQTKSLGIDLGSHSPGLLRKIVYAGSNSGSFAQGSDFLQHLAEQSVDAKTVQRATERIGEERLAQRDTLVESFEKLPLVKRDRSPRADVPDLAVIMVDGGRIQILPDEHRRQPTAPKPDEMTHPPTTIALTPMGSSESGTVEVSAPTPGVPSEGETAGASAPTPVVPGEIGTAEAIAPAAPGESLEADPQRRQGKWREDKVAALLRMESDVHLIDPCPELPEVFRDPLGALKLAREVGHLATVPTGAPFVSSGSAEKQKEAREQEQNEKQRQERQRRPGQPEVVSRQVLATRQDNDCFGPMVAASAWSQGLMGAKRRAFVADGSAANWSVQEKYFPRFEPIVDFIHVLSYVFSAGMAGRSFTEGWPVYQEWINWVWKGEVGRVLAAMRQREEELEEGSVARKSVKTSLGYLEGQQGRMDYGRYRKEGLPIMSSVIESTVKQIGRRVKGTEKFWKEAGAEAVLQLRADYLSDDQPMDNFWKQRADRMTGQRSYKRRSA
jgi:hypothetical protein